MSVKTIEFAAEGSARAECAIESSASATSLNYGRSDQTAVSSVGSIWIIIVIAITIVIGVLGIAYFNNKNPEILTTEEFEAQRDKRKLEAEEAKVEKKEKQARRQGWVDQGMKTAAKAAA